MDITPTAIDITRRISFIRAEFTLYTRHTVTLDQPGVFSNRARVVVDGKEIAVFKGLWSFYIRPKVNRCSFVLDQIQCTLTMEQKPTRIGQGELKVALMVGSSEIQMGRFGSF